MKTILVCNQKGGVGKSLVADEIAFSFERSGIPVSFYDLDAQGGTLHRTREADGAQVAVVDTPGALQEALSEWLKEADVVVIPTRTTLSLLLTVSDKKALKMMAAERETTIAAIIHEWVAEHKEDK